MVARQLKNCAFVMKLMLFEGGKSELQVLVLDRYLYTNIFNIYFAGSRVDRIFVK